MSIKSGLKKSRNNWKGTAVTRGNNLRYLRKENRRIKQERDRYKKEAREAKKQLEKEVRRKTSPVCKKEELVYIALSLSLDARISFRAIPRVLAVLRDYPGGIKIPSIQTVINWVTRLSIARIKNCAGSVGSQISGNRFSNGLIFMLDISIGLGAGKILAVPALDAGHHAYNQNAPALFDVNCIAVSVEASWTGEKIAAFLQKVIAVMGRPAAYLKDGGTDLGKAVRLLGERGLAGLSIDDISHAVANILKREYKRHPMFETFISACGSCSKRLKQTVLTCLVPPKVSTKARFMNINRLVTWADKILRHSPKGRASQDSILSKLRTSIGRIPECKVFIKRFLRDTNPLLESQKILKNIGLSQDSYRQCLKLIETIPPRSSVRIGFTKWMENQIMIAENLGLQHTGMPISSDSIESLFGVSKQHGCGKIKDANRIALRIPALCGELTRKDAQMVPDISVKEQQHIESSLPSLTKQRREVLPNPGCLDKIIDDKEEKKNLKLLPGSKKRSKNLIKLDITDHYNEAAGPLIDPQKQTPLLPRSRISNTLAH